MPRPKQNANVPVNEVLDMRQKGVQNNDIARSLGQSNFHPEQISDALNQADIKSSMDAIPPGLNDAPSPTKKPAEAPTFDSPPKFNDEPMRTESNSLPSTSAPIMFQQSQPRGFAPEPADRSNYNLMEEVAESIVQEKWDKLISGVGDIRLWKEKTDSDIQSIKQEVLRTQQRLENIQKAVLGKISEYHNSMEGVSSDIKALEKVFQKIIAPLTKNIKDLDRVTKKLKKK